LRVDIEKLGQIGVGFKAKGVFYVFFGHIHRFYSSSLECCLSSVLEHLFGSLSICQCQTA
jgi:hypothetical protein